MTSREAALQASVKMSDLGKTNYTLKELSVCTIKLALIPMDNGPKETKDR